MSWEAVSFVLRGKNRKAVLASLASPKTPTILASELHMSIPNISRALRELRSRRLVESLTPNARTGKLYVATDQGRVVLTKVKEISGTSERRR
jgi:predicted transcriptional regulator